MNPAGLFTLFKNVVDVAWSVLTFRFDASQPGRFSRNDMILLSGILFLLDVFTMGKGYMLAMGVLCGVLDVGLVWWLWRKKSEPHAGGLVCLMLVAQMRLVLHLIGLSFLGFFLGAWFVYAAYRMYKVPAQPSMA